MGTLTIKAILRESGKNTSITVPVQDRMVTLSLDRKEISFGESVTATATVSGSGSEEITGKIRFYCKWILPLVTLFIIVNGLISVFNK